MTAPDSPTPAADVETRRLLAYVAASLVAGGATVTDAELEVRRLGAHLGHRDVQVSATPTTVQLSLASGEASCLQRVGGTLRLDQSLVVGQVRRDLLAGRIPVTEAVERLRAARGKHPTYGTGGFLGGLVLVSMGICLIMQPSPANVLVAGACSMLVSLLMIASRRHALLAALLPSVAAMVASLVVLLALRAGLLDGALRTLICPIAVLLPGATLSTGVAELAQGELVSGTSRVANGVTQLLLFTLGVIGAGLLLGIAPAELGNSRVQALGAWSLPLGLACIAVGITLSEAVPWRTAAWTSLVLVGTFLAQLGGQALGHSLPVGAFCGAVVASFLSGAVEATRPNVPRLVTFLPSFWLLVPGTLGLMGITTVGLGTGQAEAVVAVVTLVTSIALGLLVGSALTLPLRRVARRVHGVVHRRERSADAS